MKRQLLYLMLLIKTSIVYSNENKSIPEPIKDNLFLMEEAYNQEPGVVQHISMIRVRLGGHALEYSFTQEFPLPTELVQFSYLIPFIRDENMEGIYIGDVLINLRIQALGRGGGNIAISPRLSLLLPTGEPTRNTGYGAIGIEGACPLSIAIGKLFAMHLNAGATFIKDAKVSDMKKVQILKFSSGIALVWHTTSWFNIFFETVYQTQNIDRSWEHEITISPSFRFAANFNWGLQVVPGIGFPIQIYPDKESSLILYISFEHPLHGE